MKTIVLIAIILGCTGFGYSQVSNEIELETVSLTEINKNKEFINIIQKQFTPDVAVELCKEAAEFDIKKHLELGIKDLYEVEFKSKKGNLNTFYDKNGVISIVNGKFRDIKMPKGLVKKVLEQNEGWKITKNKYHTSYERARFSKNWYLITLTDGKYKKEVKIII